MKIITNQRLTKLFTHESSHTNRMKIITNQRLTKLFTHEKLFDETPMRTLKFSHQ